MSEDDAPMGAPGKLLYIIHAADDKALAQYLKSQCEANVTGLRAFVASKPGQIPTGTDWLSEIHDNLGRATSFLLLLTPRSITRNWVWYEAGAAWRSGLPRYPVVAAGLARKDIPFPLASTQTLALDDPDEAPQLFVDLGGQLDTPSEFCAVVRALAVPLQPDVDEKRIRQAFGELGEPPKAVLRRMLNEGKLTREEMTNELSARRFVSDASSVERVLNALKERDLVEGDADGRWRTKPELTQTLRQCFDPPLSARMMQLSEDILAWAEGGERLIDPSEFQQKFGNRLKLLREKAERDHAEGDDWLTKLPSSTGGAKNIARALADVAGRVP